MKTCTKCLQNKYESEFKKDKRASGGLRSECADCTKKYMDEWRKKNKSKTLEYMAEWRNKNRKKLAQYAKTFHAKHKGYSTAQSRAYRAKYPGKAKKQAHDWYKNNTEKARAKYSAYRAKKKGSQTEVITAEKWCGIISKFGGMCAYCGSKDKKLTQDHVLPISKGGGHVIENLVPACMDCNRKKSGRTPEEANMPIIIKPRP